MPRRLAYPEILAELEGADGCFYDGSPEQLATRLGELADPREDLWHGDPERGVRAVARFAWPVLRSPLDDALEAAVGRGASERYTRSATNTALGEQR